MGRHNSRLRWNSGLFVLLLFGALLLAGCLTQKKREDITHRYLRENPKTLADLAAIHFPVQPKPGVPVYIPGKPIIEIRTDTLIEKDTVRIRDSVKIHTVDTLRIVDTVLDNARIEALLMAKHEVENRLIREQVGHENTRKKSTQRLYWLLGALVALAGTWGYSIFKLAKPRLL